MDSTNFADAINSLQSLDAKQQFLLDALSMCQKYIIKYTEARALLNEKEETNHQRELTIQVLEEKITHLQSAVEEKDLQLEEYKEKFERAKERYHEAKSEIENAGLIARKELYKTLVPTRDRIYVIGDTVNSAGERVSKSSKEKVSIAELNNILLSLDTIINNLSEAGLWNEYDPKPSTDTINEPPKKTTTRKSSGKKKKEPEPAVEVENIQEKMEL